MLKLLYDLRVLLLGLWLGAACFFSFAVAPGAFAVLPTPDDAGAIVNRTLAVVNYSGLIIGLILLASAYVPRGAINGFRIWLESAALFLFAAACAFGQFVIAAQMRGLRQQAGRPISDLAADDAARISFDALHAHSVQTLGTAMLLALLAFFLVAARARKSENL